MRGVLFRCFEVGGWERATRQVGDKRQERPDHRQGKRERGNDKKTDLTTSRAASTCAREGQHRSETQVCRQVQASAAQVQGGGDGRHWATPVGEQKKRVGGWVVAVEGCT